MFRRCKKRSVKKNQPLKVYERSDKHYKATLAQITQRLTKNAAPLCKDTGYDKCYFKVSYDPSNTVNAYASDGYKITIFKGLLQYLKTNDEIAAVVAHEMGHHLAKHNEEAQQNAAVGAAVSGIVTAVVIGAISANNGSYYTTYQQQQQQQRDIENMLKASMQAGAYFGALSYSKEQEREADLLATYLLKRAGYDLAKAQNVMVVLAQFASEKKRDPNRAAFLSTHPAGMERVVAWEKAIEEIKQNETNLPYPKKTVASKAKTKME